MIAEDRLSASIDQVEGLLVFEGGTYMLDGALPGPPHALCEPFVSRVVSQRDDYHLGHHSEADSLVCQLLL